jgi:hypothetical protein
MFDHNGQVMTTAWPTGTWMVHLQARGLVPSPVPLSIEPSVKGRWTEPEQAAGGAGAVTVSGTPPIDAATVTLSPLEAADEANWAAIPLDETSLALLYSACAKLDACSDEGVMISKDTFALEDVEDDKSRRPPPVNTPVMLMASAVTAGYTLITVSLKAARIASPSVVSVEKDAGLTPTIEMAADVVAFTDGGGGGSTVAVVASAIIVN